MIASFQMLVKNTTSDRMIAKRPVARVSNVMSIHRMRPINAAS